VTGGFSTKNQSMEPHVMLYYVVNIELIISSSVAVSMQVHSANVIS
jgi:hypothetical protein